MCLSTVDRRSRERFIESNNQISALVEKFKLEGGPYRKVRPQFSAPRCQYNYHGNVCLISSHLLCILLYYLCIVTIFFVLCQYAGPNLSELDHLEHHQKIPLTAYGRPGLASVVANLVQRQWAQLNLFRLVIVLNIAK